MEKHHTWGVNKKKEARLLRKKGVGTLDEISMPNEEWRDVPIEGLSGLYSVSSLGRVYSPLRIRRSGILNSSKTIMPPSLIVGGISKNGYRRFIAVDYSGKRLSISIHRIVAAAFLDNIQCKPMVNHINGIKTDNRIENLEWVTASENSRHAISLGLCRASEGRVRQIILIKDCAIIEIDGINKAAKTLGSSPNTIRKYANTKTEVHGYQIAI